MLENLRVIEFATMVAAPAAGGLLPLKGQDPLPIRQSIGEHTLDILNQLGYTETDIGRMRDNCTIPVGYRHPWPSAI